MPQQGGKMAKGTVNKVIIVGRLGADPDMRYTASGLAIASFNVATNERVPAGEGNWEDRTEWHRVKAFGKLAEICGNYLNKGKQVYVEGSLRTNQWEDSQGVKRYSTEIVARDIEMLGSPGGESGTHQDHGGQPRGGQRSGREDLPPAPPSSSDEDIPF
jgi:single-strand DNA-binding protein